MKRRALCDQRESSYRFNPLVSSHERGARQTQAQCFRLDRELAVGNKGMCPRAAQNNLKQFALHGANAGGCDIGLFCDEYVQVMMARVASP